jgi:hypothetical protein
MWANGNGGRGGGGGEESVLCGWKLMDGTLKAPSESGWSSVKEKLDIPGFCTITSIGLLP